jgi:O-antigen/teichoic acid export membrane protein
MTLQRLMTALLGYVGARFFGAGLGLVTQVALARTLPPSEVAMVFMAMSAAAFLSLIMNGGHTQLASTHIPRILAHDRAGTRRRSLAAFHGVVLHDMVWTGLVLAIAVAATWYFGLFSNELRAALVVGMVTAPMSGVMRYNSIIANSLRWFPLSYIPDFIIRPLLFLLAILAVLVLAPANAVWWVLMAFMAGVWLVTIGMAMAMTGEHVQWKHFTMVNARHASALRPRAFALLVVGTVTYAFADIVMLLSGIVFDAADAAVVGVAIRLAAIAGFILQAAQLFVLPDYTEAVVRGDDRAANSVLWRMNSLTLAVIAAGLLGTVLLGRFALSLFGPEYAAGQGLLVMFIIGQSIRAMGGMNQSLLAIRGFQIRTAVSCFIALLILVFATLQFTRLWGLEGLGYAVILAEIAWVLGLATQAQRLCGKRADIAWLALNTR